MEKISENMVLVNPPNAPQMFSSGSSPVTGVVLMEKTKACVNWIADGYDRKM
jgi:hypothetical protein